jgi:hypothetical protein
MASPTSRVKKKDAARHRRVRLEQQAFELAKQCPVDHVNPVDCPLSGVRRLAARERRGWIRRLSDEELEYLATYHRCCLAVKTKQPRR